MFNILNLSATIVQFAAVIKATVVPRPVKSHGEKQPITPNENPDQLKISFSSIASLFFLLVLNEWTFGDGLLSAVPVAISLFTPFLAAFSIPRAEN